MHALVEQNTRLVSAQSTPLLMLDTGNIDPNGKLVISMTLGNVGTGPARIAWFRVSDDQGVSYAGGDFYERLSKQDPEIKFTSQQISRTLMRSGEERSVFRWSKPAAKEMLPEWETLNKTRFGLHASACYCSIFDECRVTRFGDSRPEPVPSCETGAGKGKS